MSKFKHLAWKPYLAVVGFALVAGYIPARAIFAELSKTAVQLNNIGIG